jgi:formylglycine-generating enzyme required for sulfatase activity
MRKGGKPVELPACLLFIAAAAAAPMGGGRTSIATMDGPVDGMVFALLPGGAFEIGSPEGDPLAEPDEGPVRAVALQPFQIMTTEVTQAMWLSVMGENPSHFTGEASRPVEMVSWDDCQAFVDSINSRDDGYTYRLPSEAEWEYACRAGSTTSYSWGETDAVWTAGSYGWIGDNSGNSTHPVGLLRPNAWGLYDMVGNVTEWCQDIYHDSYDGLPADGSAWESGGGETRILRGSWWSCTILSSRSAHRGDYAPGHRLNYAGLRLVRT